jgi:hypothetical protein
MFKQNDVASRRASPSRRTDRKSSPSDGQDFDGVRIVDPFVQVP